MLSFIHSNFKLDLTYLQVTFVEENQWFKDDFSNEFSIPFELDLRGEFSKNPDFDNHYNAIGNKTIYRGYLDKDGELSEATLKIQKVVGDIASILINSGLESFPNFDKRLMNLPLEQKEVEDITADAENVIKLDYPETNYNFPMVHTDKYDPTSDEWHGFEKIINNYVSGSFVENELDLETNIDSIKNIVQPMPYAMHVLKTAILDAGYTLEGDILNDADFKQALLFRDGDYYNRISRDEIPIVYKNDEWDSIYVNGFGIEHAVFAKEIVIEKKGDYIIFGDIVSLIYKTVPFTGQYYSNLQISIRKNSTFLFSYSLFPTTGSLGPYKSLISTRNIDLTVSLDVGDIIKINKLEPRRDLDPSPTPDYPDAVFLKLIPVRYRNPDGSPIISVSNLNQIDLKKVVTDATTRDLVVAIKNWKNYDFIVNEKVVYMNLIEPQLTRANAKNISENDIEEPIRDYHDDREFELSFTDGKSNSSYIYDSALVTKEGVTINNYSLKQNATSIKIDALPLPVISRNGITTAYSLDDEPSKLRLVFKKPTPEDGNPTSFVNENMLIPKIVESNYLKWLNFRINSINWTWDFIISVEKFRDIKIQSIIYAYDNYHVFTDIEKERIDMIWWRITAKTESLL